MTTEWELWRRDSSFVSSLCEGYCWRGTHAVILVTSNSAAIVTQFSSQDYFPNAIYGNTCIYGASFRDEALHVQHMSQSKSLVMSFDVHEKMLPLLRSCLVLEYNSSTTLLLFWSAIDAVNM